LKKTEVDLLQFYNFYPKTVTT